MMSVSGLFCLSAGINVERLPHIRSAWQKCHNKEATSNRRWLLLKVAAWRLLECVGLAVFVVEEFLRLGIVYELLHDRVPLDGTAQVHCDIRKVADCA